jgi:hypothetical protein
MSRENVAADRRIGPIDLDVLGARLREQTQIDDPTAGAAEPLEVEARSRLWPHTSMWALIELTSVCGNGARRLEEYRFVPAAHAEHLPEFQGGGLPVAILFERSPNGASRARIYSTRALAATRTPTLPADPRIVLKRAGDEPWARYVAALEARDMAAALALFSAQGYVQWSDGERYQGRARLHALFERALERSAGTVRYCSRFDDGPQTVLELLLPDGRPALWVFQREGTRSLAAVRVYR